MRNSISHLLLSNQTFKLLKKMLNSPSSSSSLSNLVFLPLNCTPPWSLPPLPLRPPLPLPPDRPLPPWQRHAMFHHKCSKYSLPTMYRWVTDQLWKLYCCLPRPLDLCDSCWASIILFSTSFSSSPSSNCQVTLLSLTFSSPPFACLALSNASFAFPSKSRAPLKKKIYQIHNNNTAWYTQCFLKYQRVYLPLWPLL